MATADPNQFRAQPVAPASGMSPQPQYPPPQWQPPAGWADAAVAGLKYLTQYRLAELLIVVLLIGYFGWLEPVQNKERMLERQAINETNNKTIEKIVVESGKTNENVAKDLKEALHETKEAFIGESMQLRRDAQLSNDRYLLMMEKVVGQKRPE
jgi:hypothetical protein